MSAAVEHLPAGFREQPHNTEAEQALLGAILVNNETWHRVAGFLRPEHFYEPVHGRIFAAISRLISAGRIADPHMLKLEFHQDEALRELDGAQYLGRLALAAEAIINAEDYGRLVRDYAVRRGLIRLCEDATNIAFDGTADDAAQQLATVRTNLEHLTREATFLNGAELVMLADCRLDFEVFWSIDGILPKCNMALCYGYGGSGKTYLGASITLGIARGRWFNHEAETGAVLYCAFERPQDAEDRLAALRDHFEYQDLAIGLLKLGGKRLDDDRAGAIIDHARRLAEQTEQPVRAVVIDTVAAALGGAREDDEGFGRLRMIGERIHAETGATVIWLHHEGKGEGRGPRGHTSLADACAVWWHVEERESGDRVAHVEKASRGPCHLPLFSFKLVPFDAGRDNRGKVIELCKLEMTDLESALASPPRKRFGEAKDDKPEAGLGDRQRRLLRVLRNLLKKHPDGVERSTLRSHFILELGDADPQRAATAFRQTLGSLRKRELVHEDGDLITD